MLKRSLLTLLALLALLLIAPISLLPLLAARASLDAPAYLLTLSLWVALLPLLLLGLANILLKNIWFFPATADPLPLETLRERLLAVNAMACPVAATAKRKKIIVTWRIAAMQWCELLSRLGIDRLFELHCRFDPDTRTVILVDRIRHADFLICPQQVTVSRRHIPLPLLRARLARLRRIDDYPTLDDHDYDFHPREIKSPVMGTILACGWNVRFSLF